MERDNKMILGKSEKPINEVLISIFLTLILFFAGFLANALITSKLHSDTLGEDTIRKYASIFIIIFLLLVGVSLLTIIAVKYYKNKKSQLEEAKNAIMVKESEFFESVKNDLSPLFSERVE